MKIKDPLTLSSPTKAGAARNTNGNLPFYLFANMVKQPGLVHGIFTRQGGESRAPFDSLNVGLGIGDQPAAVAGNRRRVAACLGVDQLIFCNQVHEDGIRVFKDGDRHGRAGFDHEEGSGDAMITDMPGICLAIQVADCQAVVIYDPDRAVVANVHSGWRGSIINIIGRTVAAMTAEFGCDPGSLVAGVSPSLGPCCAEFVNYQLEIPKRLWPYRVSQDHFDFWAISRDQLSQAGIPNENIEITGCCTRCHPDHFFSYRVEQVTGRFVVAAGLTAGDQRTEPQKRETQRTENRDRTAEGRSPRRRGAAVRETLKKE
jgi:YfiH family protein